MQNKIKRNSVVLVTLNNTQRLALVKSVRSNNKVNCVVHLYANSSICSDYLVDASAVTATNIPAKYFNSLAKSYPNYAATDSTSKKLFALQAQADSLYPNYAALRNNYEPSPYSNRKRYKPFAA
jgi:homoserine trans-succinylase